MFAKSLIVFAVCFAMVIAAPEPKAEPKPDPLLVSTYNAGLPVLNSYSTYSTAGLPVVNTYSTAGLPLVNTYSAAHGIPVHARTLAYNTAGLRTVAVDASPLVRTVAADVPVALSAVNPLHYSAVSSPVVAAVAV